MAYTCTRACLNTTAVDQVTYLVLKGSVSTTGVTVGPTAIAVDELPLTGHYFSAEVVSGSVVTGSSGRVTVKLTYVGTDDPALTAAARAGRAAFVKRFKSLSAILTGGSVYMTAVQSGTGAGECRGRLPHD